MVISAVRLLLIMLSFTRHVTGRSLGVGARGAAGSADRAEPTRAGFSRTVLADQPPFGLTMRTAGGERGLATCHPYLCPTTPAWSSSASRPRTCGTWPARACPE